MHTRTVNGRILSGRQFTAQPFKTVSDCLTVELYHPTIRPNCCLDCQSELLAGHTSTVVNCYANRSSAYLAIYSTHVRDLDEVDEEIVIETRSG